MADVDGGFVDRGDHLVIPVVGGTIDQIAFDYAVTLVINAEGGRWEVRIETPFVVTTDSGGERLVVPEEHSNPHAVLALLHLEVSGAIAFTDGALRLEVQDSYRVEVAPDEAYEAWGAVGPGGARLVAVPGGELAVWSAG